MDEILVMKNGKQIARLELLDWHVERAITGVKYEGAANIVRTLRHAIDTNSEQIYIGGLGIQDDISVYGDGVMRAVDAVAARLGLEVEHKIDSEFTRDPDRPRRSQL